MNDYKTASPDRYGLLKAYARENRRNPTMAEQVLWKNIRGEQLGVRALRQYVIGDYIVDFLLPDADLVIEVDGAYHSERLQMEDDKLREEHLNRMGYRVIRFTNEEVLYDTQNTLDEIMSKIEEYE